MTRLDAALVLDARTELGEGPVWDARRSCLYFVDILRGHVHRFDPASGHHRTYETGTTVGAVAPIDSGSPVSSSRKN